MQLLQDERLALTPFRCPHCRAARNPLVWSDEALLVTLYACGNAFHVTGDVVEDRKRCRRLDRAEAAA